VTLLFRLDELTASRLGSSNLVIIGGLAELLSGAISMGLGAYLAAVTERDHYLTEEKRERQEIQTKHEDEKEEIYDIMSAYGISRSATTSIVNELVQDPESWIRVRRGVLGEPHIHDTRLIRSLVHDGFRAKA